MNITITSRATRGRAKRFRRGLVAMGGACALWFGLSTAAQAGPSWSVGVGVPGAAVQVRGGHPGWQHGRSGGPRYYGGHRGYPGYWRQRGWRGPGWSVWGPAIGIGIGLPLAVYGVESEPVYVTPAPPPAPPPPSAPDPVVYPRNHQTAQQAESDRRACDRWATTQPAAMADASVFHRSVEACMDGRGYTIR